MMPIVHLTINMMPIVHFTINMMMPIVPFMIKMMPILPFTINMKPKYLLRYMMPMLLLSIKVMSMHVAIYDKQDDFSFLHYNKGF